MARNSVIDLYRKKKNQQTIDLEKVDESKLPIATAANIEKQLDLSADKKILFEALQKLKTEYREVVTLKYVEELKTSEIAEITGKRKVAVRVTLHRAVKKLKEILVDNDQLR